MPRLLRTAIIFLLIAAPAAAQIMYRPGREQRTINTDAYAIVVQKNGRVDVRLPNGELIFDNAYPAVWFEGDRRPSYLPIEGLQTAREPVRDVLGQGQGMVFRKGSGEWVIRTYLTQPFITVQCAFVNDSRRPVTVSRLMPWVVGPPATGMLSLGPGTADSIMRPMDSLTVPMDAIPGLQHGQGHSGWSLAMVNPTTGRSIIAGFLTDGRGASYIETGEAEGDAFTRFRAVTVFDPPVVVPPGGRIESDALYIAVTEPDPVSGLARYGNAFARVNEASRGNLPDWQRWETAASFQEQYGAQVGNGSVPLSGRMHPLIAPERPIAASWDPPHGTMGIVDAVAWLGAHFHYTPYLARPVLAANWMAGMSAPLDEDSRLAWYSFCAIAGAPVIAIGGDDADPNWRNALDRLVPAIERPARPADAFVHDAPQVWHTPLGGLEGDAHLVGLFNWNPGESASFSLHFPALGMAPGTDYAVFDFWAERHHGTARGNLNVEVPPGAGRLMLFRSLLGRPVLLADPAHFAMGAAHPQPATWNDERATLSGRVPAGTGRLHLLVPSGFRLLTAEAGASPVTHTQSGEVLTIEWPPTATETEWQAQFSRAE